MKSLDQAIKATKYTGSRAAARPCHCLECDLTRYVQHLQATGQGEAARRTIKALEVEEADSDDDNAD